LLKISNLLTYLRDVTHFVFCASTELGQCCASHISMFLPSYGWSPTYGYLHVGTFLYEWYLLFTFMWVP